MQSITERIRLHFCVPSSLLIQKRGQVQISSGDEKYHLGLYTSSWCPNQNEVTFDRTQTCARVIRLPN